MEDGNYYSVYSLGCSIASLRALKKKGWVKQKSSKYGVILGSSFCPQVSLQFKRIK